MRVYRSDTKEFFEDVFTALLTVSEECALWWERGPAPRFTNCRLSNERPAEVTIYPSEVVRIFVGTYCRSNPTGDMLGDEFEWKAESGAVEAQTFVPTG